MVPPRTTDDLAGHVNDAQQQDARSSTADLQWLVDIMRRLLAPDGCPWDREQTLQTLRPYLVEECYELLEAIDSGDRAHHCEELGDLLLQIVFQAELATISTDEIIRTIGDKLIRRHPHVFGEVHVRDAEEVVTNWEVIKAQEQGNRKRESALDGVPAALPALHRGHQLLRKAARAGFVWPAPRDARAKVDEELDEVDHAVAARDPAAAHEEIGDLLLAVTCWANQLGVEPEQALRDANRRFERRFRKLERAAAADCGTSLAECPPDRLRELWRGLRRVGESDQSS